MPLDLQRLKSQKIHYTDSLAATVMNVIWIWLIRWDLDSRGEIGAPSLMLLEGFYYQAQLWRICFPAEVPLSSHQLCGSIMQDLTAFVHPWITVGTVDSRMGSICSVSFDDNDFVISKAGVWFWSQRFLDYRRGSSSLVGLFCGVVLSVTFPSKICLFSLPTDATDV